MLATNKKQFCTNPSINILIRPFTCKQDPKHHTQLQLTQHMMKVLARRSQQKNIIHKSSIKMLWSPNQTLSGQQLCLEILSIKIINRTGNKGQRALGIGLTAGNANQAPVPITTQKPLAEGDNHPVA